MVPLRSVSTAELLPCHHQGVCTIMHSVGDGVVDESEKSTASGRVIAPVGGIACELLVRGVNAEFGLLHTGDQYLVTVKEGLQL